VVGRFPIVAGLQVVWDSRLPPNQRVKSIDLVSHHKPRVPKPKHTDSSHSSGTHTPRPRPNDPSHSTFTPSNDDSDSSSSDESEAEDLLSSHVKTTDTSGRPISFSLLEDGTKISIRRKKAAFLEPIKREKGGRMYRVVTRDYMAQGYDGYEAMKGSRYIVDDENGMLFSSLLRNFLLGFVLPFTLFFLDLECQRHYFIS
jgi:5'-nucleotidase